MSISRGPFKIANRYFNPVFGKIVRSPLGKIVAKNTFLITITGRVSGKPFTFPVTGKRVGQIVTVRVMVAKKKLWWRNLSGLGAPVTIEIGGVTQCGHGVAKEVGSKVTVEITLDDPTEQAL